MLIGAVQMDIVKGDKPANLAKVAALLAGHRVDLAVLPELFSTGYFYDTRAELEAIAEAVPGGETTAALVRLAADTGCHLIGTIVEAEAGHLYITAVVAGPEGYIGKHRKRHLTRDETEFYAYGTESAVFPINGCKVGVIICFEGWFPESIRELMLKGAQVVCHSALIYSPKTLEVMRVRAMENKVFLAVSNSISTECFHGQPLTFRGESQIIDYQGHILDCAGNEERLVLAEVAVTEVTHKDLEDCADLPFEVYKHQGMLDR